MQAPKPELAANATDSKTDVKIAGKKDKLAEAKTADVAVEVLADSVTEKLHQQRLSLHYLCQKQLVDWVCENFFPSSHHVNLWMKHGLTCSHS